MTNALDLIREIKEANLLNPKLGTSKTLDLHENNFFLHTWNEIVKRDPKGHIPGIHFISSFIFFFLATLS